MAVPIANVQESVGSIRSSFGTGHGMAHDPCTRSFWLQMCSIAVPGMKARKRGAIVNVGSGSATFLPSYPLYAVYGATKVGGATDSGSSMINTVTLSLSC